MKYITKALILLFFAMNGILSFAQDREFKWPDGKKAAIAFTYDDGMKTHLSSAMPDLEAANFRGTFYITGKDMTPEKIIGLRKAAEKGHELGSHTLFHPCSSNESWVWKEFQTEGYTFRKMRFELEVMNNFLFAIDGKTKRTYAYPCHIKELGDGYYVDSLAESGLYTAARNGVAPELKDIKKLNPFDVPSLSLKDSEDLEIAKLYVEQAIENKTLAVFCIHGVGGEYIVLSRKKHQEIIQYVKDREDDVWVAPLEEIMTYYKAEMNRINKLK